MNVSYSVPVVKPGFCPAPGIGICVELCGGDQTCPGDQKCCSNGCGHACMDPGKQNTFINHYTHWCGITFHRQISRFIYLGFYVAFNTVQVILRRVVGRAEETVHTVRQGSVL